MEEKIIIVNHTECGMATLKDEYSQRKLSEKCHSNASDIKFHSFDDSEENVKNQIAKIKSTPFLSNIVSVHGFIYDIKTGIINEVSA